MPLQISSPQNRRIKELLKLSKRRKRDERRVTIVEGVREVARALASGHLPREAFLCPALINDPAAEQVAEQLYRLENEQKLALFEVSREIYARIAYRGESGGILATIPYLAQSLDQLPLADCPFLAIVEGVEKPGNLGAILRTADGAGVDGVIICHAPGQTMTDMHNPNVVRASLGTLFAVPVAETTTADALLWLHENNIASVAAMPNAKNSYTSVDMRGAIAIVMGSEADGLSAPWCEQATHQVAIPMHGVADSLNLSTSTALMLYEVVRQRSA